MLFRTEQECRKNLLATPKKSVLVRCATTADFEVMESLRTLPNKIYNIVNNRFSTLTGRGVGKNEVHKGALCNRVPSHCVCYIGGS